MTMDEEVALHLSRKLFLLWASERPEAQTAGHTLNMDRLRTSVAMYAPPRKLFLLWGSERLEAQAAGHTLNMDRLSSPKPSRE